MFIVIKCATAFASQKIGIRPYWTNGKTEVDHDREGTITISPGLRIFLSIRVAIANKFAEEPELFETTL